MAFSIRLLSNLAAMNAANAGQQKHSTAADSLAPSAAIIPDLIMSERHFAGVRQRRAYFMCDISPELLLPASNRHEFS